MKTVSIESSVAHIDDVRDTIAHARLCGSAWRYLTVEHENRDLVLSGFDAFPMFFETTQKALFTCFCVKLCSLFGQRADEITLKSVPNIESDSEFDRLWQAGRNLYKYRNKIIAHRDSKTPPETVAKELKITHDQLLSLTEDVSRLFERTARKSGFIGNHSVNCVSDLEQLLMISKTTASSGT
jgi:hypothetical protein